MSALDAIAVKVVDEAGAASGNATALLHEAAKLLEAFVQSSTLGTIDLRSLPLTPGDYDELREALGAGAVFARVDAIGPSELRETRYPGLWWVTHFNDAGEIVAELIEIGPVPQILVAPMQDVAAGLSGFKEALVDAIAPKL
jgi:HupH hydrogenase expression protein